VFDRFVLLTRPCLISTLTKHSWSWRLLQTLPTLMVNDSDPLRMHTGALGLQDTPVARANRPVGVAMLSIWVEVAKRVLEPCAHQLTKRGALLGGSPSRLGNVLRIQVPNVRVQMGLQHSRPGRVGWTTHTNHRTPAMGAV
jgi:hypothetical protein